MPLVLSVLRSFCALALSFLYLDACTVKTTIAKEVSAQSELFVVGREESPSSALAERASEGEAGEKDGIKQNVCFCLSPCLGGLFTSLGCKSRKHLYGFGRMVLVRRLRVRQRDRVHAALQDLDDAVQPRRQRQCKRWFLGHGFQWLHLKLGWLWIKQFWFPGNGLDYRFQFI